MDLMDVSILAGMLIESKSITRLSLNLSDLLILKVVCTAPLVPSFVCQILNFLL